MATISTGDDIRRRADAVLMRLPEVRTWQEPLYRDLHENPELSHQEKRTAGVVADRLRRSGLTVHEGVGGTGVVGVLGNGGGPRVLMRADMDALPVTEATGLPYASTHDGVMHACGHDVHVTCLLGAAELFARATDHWRGTMITVFQPAEEVGDGARTMVEDGLADLVGPVDVALAQHVFPLPAGQLRVRSGPVMAAADSLRVTVFGRGGHGSMPQATVDPVVLASMIVIRLQTIVSREVDPSQMVVLTVGSIQAGTKSNVIGDHAVLELNLRTFDESVRTAVLAAIRRVVIAECQASDSPREPEFELYANFPLTVNDDAVTARVEAAFSEYFGDRAQTMPAGSASEDFSDIPAALGAPYTYWGFGGIDEEAFRAAVSADRTRVDIPVNHSPRFGPVLQPTLDTGTEALVVAGLSWL